MGSPDAKKSRQVAALPYRFEEGELRVLLVTSRETQRWIIPKGWPMKGKKPHRAAEREALEEAGVKGRIDRRAIGHYEAWKRLTDHFILCNVKVYPLEVREQRKKWREQGERRAVWFKAVDAADLVDEPGLRTIIRAFAQGAAQVLGGRYPAVAGSAGTPHARELAP
ncbi:NUDIX hydrolase [uncultured Alsobacter sp.]|uniref:NUDIX hydrolase n=1 Tax=uncultured Alsobacter sp. TaxID=1748258 RepID=UPI0025F1E622|nr:NUDIX hydrolase [uncultured Alsobacter sp.]